MSIFNHLDEFATALSEEEFSPALPERLAVTKQLLASESPSLRSVAAPRYVTDLGVRRSSDAERFYDIHCNLAKITPLSKEQLYTYLSAIPTEHLHFHLDACILMFGAYGACADYITQAQEELLAQGSYTTLLYCGEILAAVSNTNALCFLIGLLRWRHRSRTLTKPNTAPLLLRRSDWERRRIVTIGSYVPKGSI